MSLEQRTTQQVSELIIAQLEASLSTTLPLLPRSFSRVLAKTLAGVFTLLYKYGGFIFLQIFPSTATDEETLVNGVKVRPLTFWGVLIGVGPPTQATQAQLLVEVTVVNQIGTLPAGAQLIGGPNGVTYITLAGVPLDAATKQVEVRAVSDPQGGSGFGTVGNLSPGDVISLANPLPNVKRGAVVVSQSVTAAEAEATEVYRQRVIDRFRKRPQGGAYADYELWGEEVAGIVAVYPYTGSPGQVDVYSEATPESSGDPDGIPTAAQLQAVLDNINLDPLGIATRRNANAFVNSLPITRRAFDVTVSGISGVVDLGQTQTDVADALQQFFLSLEPFIPGLSIPPRRDVITRTKVSALVEDVVTAAGGTFTSATFNFTGLTGGISTYTLLEGEKAKVQTVSFTP